MFFIPRLLLIASLLFPLTVFCQRPGMQVIPRPVVVQEGPGTFLADRQTVIVVPDGDSAWNRLADFLATPLRRSTGLPFLVQTARQTSARNNSIRLALISGSRDREWKAESYQLKVNPEEILLEASDFAGLFYGVQTLLQLFPPEVESLRPQERYRWEVPAVHIEDYPRFHWRGILLDVVRHFFTVDEVKRFIDEMVRYKFNVLHWHLTNDQGWRIEIRSLPKLTGVGAWRVPRVGEWGEFTTPEPSEKPTYGGFYTQEEIRDIVRYAAERQVRVMPEINMPGHSLAAIAAYPEISCTAGPRQVNAGQALLYEKDGEYRTYVDNTLCPANEITYRFIDQVIGEVAELFPFEYIHMGGDECARNWWAASPSVRALMKREKLRNLDEVQSYFVRRVDSIIRAHGKRMIGWDEILDGGLVPGAAVMSWRGMDGGRKAAAAGHPVVMSPNTFTYVDLFQGDPLFEPSSYSMLRLRQAYRFEPLPAGVDSTLILGGQAQVWTEQITNLRSAQYMMWPRTFAVAECLWSPRSVRNWNDFVTRVESQFQRLQLRDVKYATSMYEPIVIARKNEGGELVIELQTEIDDLVIHYSFDVTFPDDHYPVYQAPLQVPRDAFNLRVVTYRKGKQVGRILTMPIDALKKRAAIR